MSRTVIPSNPNGICDDGFFDQRLEKMTIVMERQEYLV